MKHLLYIILFTNVISYSQIAPEGAIYNSQTIRHGYEILSTDYPYPEAWFQAAPLTFNSANDGYVKIDYYKFIEIDPQNNIRIVDKNDYNYSQKSLDPSEGGLYSWVPSTTQNLFCADFVAEMDNANIDGSCLVIYAGKHGNLVSHWWSKRVNGKIGYKYEVEVRFLIHGDIGLQIGCDFYNKTEGGVGTMNPEPWVSDWFNDTKGEYRTETVPLYDANIKYSNGVDYGVTTKGKFFVSTRLINHCGGSRYIPQLLSDFGDKQWQGTPMSLDGDYWIYETGKTFGKNDKIKFCIHVIPTSSDHYLPHIIVNDGTLENMDDALDNGKEGYNFFISTVKE